MEEQDVVVPASTVLNNVASAARLIVPRVDSEDPRYICCGQRVKVLSRWIIITEIVIAILLIVILLPLSSAQIPVALPSVAVTLTIYVTLKVAVAVVVLIGLRRQSYQCLIAYLVFKGLEIGAAAVAILISFLCLFGFTAMFGFVTSALTSNTDSLVDRFPTDPHYATPPPHPDDQAQPPVTHPKDPDDFHAGDISFKDNTSETATTVTGIMSAVVVSLCLIIGIGIFSFIVILKCYRLIRDRVYMEYNSRIGSRGNSLVITGVIGGNVIIAGSTAANTNPAAELDGETIVFTGSHPGTRVLKLQSTEVEPQQSMPPPPPYSKDDPEARELLANERL